MGATDERELVGLLEAARAGEAEALSKLLERLRPEIERYLRGRLRSSPGTDAVAEELTQESLMRVAASIAACRAGTARALRAWTRTLARRVAIDWYRRREVEIERRVWQEVEELRLAMMEDAVRGAGATARRERSPAIDQVLGELLMEAQSELSEGTREVIRRRLLYGDSWSEAGRAVGTTAAGAKRRWQRARERLRREVVHRAQSLPDEVRSGILRKLGEIETDQAP